MDVHTRIREGRKRLGLSLTAFGKACGVSRSAVAQWEDGRGAPTRAHQPKVADLLGISVGQLMADSQSVIEYSARAMRLAQLFDACEDPERQRICYAQAQLLLTTQAPALSPSAPPLLPAPTAAQKQGR